MSKRVSVILVGFLLWLGIAAAGLYGARGLQYDNDKWLSPDNPNEIARTMLASEFNQFESTMLLFKADNLFTEKGYERAAAFSDAVKNIDGVVDVVSAYDASLTMSDEAGSLVITTYRAPLDNGQLTVMATPHAPFYKRASL